MSLLPPPPESESREAPPLDMPPVEVRPSRFDQSLKDFLAAANLEHYAAAFANSLSVQSSQDLCLLSSDEMKTLLTPEEVDKLHALMKLRGIVLIPPKSLVGKWVDVDGIGPGLVCGYKKVTNSLLYDSQHIIDFSISGGSKKEKVLLRRRKLFKWNQGIRYHILGDKPSPKYVEHSLADEEAKLHSAVQSRKLLNDLHAAESETGSPSLFASSMLSTHGVPMEEIKEEDSRQRSSSSATSSIRFPSQNTPPDEDVFSFSFDLRTLSKVLGPSASFVHVTFRMAQRYSFAIPPTNIPDGSVSSSSPNIGGMAMCEWSTLEHWATEQAYRGYDVSNPYHNALHATDVALTANAYLDSCGALGPVGTNPQMRWWWHRYALMLASLCHDLGHPARMNPFMVVTKHRLTLDYLDQGGGVLEAMHVVKFGESLRLPGCNVLEGMNGAAAEARMKETVVELILATDLGRQGEILGTWNSAAETGFTFDGNPAERVAEDRLLLLKVVLKGADVSNPAKPLPIYLYWTEKILEEFYDQGDEEKRLNLPVTSMPQCDRTQPAVPAGQKGFIAFVVRPIFSALADFEKQNGRVDGNMNTALENLDSNLAFWKKVEADVPRDALLLAQLPSDLPLYDLAPEEMAGEMKAAEEMKAENEKEFERQQMMLINTILQEAAVPSKVVEESTTNSPSSESASSAAASDEKPKVDGEEAPVVASLRSENEALAQALAQAEATIKALQEQSVKPSTANEEEEEESRERFHTASGSIIEEQSEPSSASSPAAPASDEYAASKAVGARIRALQTQITLMNVKDPNSQSRFLHQPAGHRMEPMMDINTYSHAGNKKAGTLEAGGGGGGNETEKLVLADGAVMDTKASADAIANRRNK